MLPRVIGAQGTAQPFVQLSHLGCVQPFLLSLVIVITRISQINNDIAHPGWVIVYNHQYLKDDGAWIWRGTRRVKLNRGLFDWNSTAR